jgi:formylmethanofuran dehydrogenase subunit E
MEVARIPWATSLLMGLGIKNRPLITTKKRGDSCGKKLWNVEVQMEELEYGSIEAGFLHCYMCGEPMNSKTQAKPYYNTLICQRCYEEEVAALNYEIMQRW